ncbi:MULTISPECIES: hypothetical protein [unclassified Haematobacter]|uniref:hypothetical protein n=1 Tax=unclassified Haematobacter TaxID=2640585 RepID=UPI0025C02400|nr:MULTISPECIES: hypothetical protein [unclassified Haematobacter]
MAEFPMERFGELASIDGAVQLLAMKAYRLATEITDDRTSVSAELERCPFGVPMPLGPCSWPELREDGRGESPLIIRAASGHAAILPFPAS